MLYLLVTLVFTMGGAQMSYGLQVASLFLLMLYIWV